MMTFAKRCAKEILRDPLNLGFGLGFPLVLLVLLSTLQANIPVPLFEIDTLTPGITVFGLSFMTLFSATLVAMTENALIQYPDLPIVYGGGVMSNKFISSELGKRFDAYFAKSEFSCDNAAGIARMTELKHTKQI